MKNTVKDIHCVDTPIHNMIFKGMVYTQNCTGGSQFKYYEDYFCTKCLIHVYQHSISFFQTEKEPRFNATFVSRDVIDENELER